MSLDECDRLIQSAAQAISGAHAILCLYTGSTPPFCEAMARDPVPDLEWPLADLASEFIKAKLINPTIEDGVLMFGRGSVAAPYRSSGWSFRLFPPPVSAATVANRGSAFNSCLAMSQVEGVDALYQLGGEQTWRFHLGLATALRSA